eukprot:TRINITY_DN2172_c0_g1_i2.p1 TRINITY_DN2172_c0_g1~~TRINITY_DN2172_c0_g1_i2.p1  ORF type:complete len:164 (+),score=23.69 TRINITY_DN2172_c0_g1_i2:446-937(+)
MLTAYPEQEVREKITISIRSKKPDVVITWFPQPDFTAPPLTKKCPYCWGDLGYHPDHQCVGRICFDAVIGPSVDNNLMFSELKDAGLPGWKVPEFYMFGLVNNGITHYVNISGVLDKKINAFLKHKSQVQDNGPLVTTAFTWIAGSLGVPSGSSYAENYISFN